MKTRSRNLPLERRGDTPAMKAAVATLLAWGVKPLRPASPYQIIIGGISYYPDTGTMNFDSRKREPRKGLEALRELLINQGILK